MFCSGFLVPRTILNPVMAGLILTVFLVIPPVSHADQIDLAGLLEEMLDRSRIAEFPETEYLCKQVSSYDRLSRKPGNADWFANSDSSHFIGSEEVDGRTEWILMDVDGPGVIVRWWITQYKYDGTIRMYLDGSAKPIFQGTADKLIGGDHLAGPPLSASKGWGRNLYFPIPYRKHCKITYDGPNRIETGKFEDCLYYNINYLQYSKGTDLKTFTMADLKANSDLIARVQRELLQPEKNALDVERTIKGGKTVLDPGQTMHRDVTGKGAICVLRIKVSGDDVRQAMRSTVISANFDGKQRVWAPVGEFFGTGLGVNAFKGWWRQVSKDGWMTCWWPMPFRKNASISISNHGTSDVTVELADIGVTGWPWTERTMYFHSTWRGENLVDIGSDKSKMQEWNYVTIDGKGVYVGDTLALFNRPQKGPIGPWWGEGDEKIFVDGESFPSHFGTGTEDYFGYAWGTSEFFEAPFHAQPCGDANKGPGHTTNTRVRVLDKIPFNSRLKFDMELSHWQTTRIDYATTCHWYAFDGSECNVRAMPEKVCSKVGFEPETSKVIHVTEFGVKPDSRINAVRGVRAAIEACRNETSATLVFPKGRYDFWAQYCEEIEYHESNTTDNNPKICPIVLKGIKGLTIDGQGSVFVCHGRMQPLTLENCQGVTVRNIDIDWDIPFVAQARIVEVKEDYIDIEINKVESPYEIKNDKIYFHGEGWKSGWWGCMEFDARTRIIPQKSGDNPLGGGWRNYKAQELGDGLVRLNHAFKRKPKAGNILIMRHSARDHSGVFIYRCQDTVFENVNLFTAAGLGFLGQYSRNITLKNSNVMPNYAKGRYLCGHADGFQVSNCRGHVVVDGCKFEGLMDDPINVHGTSVKIIEKKGHDRLLCRFMEGMSTGMTWGHVEDKVGFIENKSMVTVGYGKIKAYTRMDRDRFEVEFAEAVPAKIEVGDALENLTWAPDFTVRNSMFGSCRARGLLVSTPGRVVIENNDFISSGAAILIAGDANGWYESGGVRDVLIRGNRFHPSCLTSWYQFGEGIISIYPIIPEFDQDRPFHRNIRIEGNHFDVFDYSVLYALSVEGLRFNNNTIKHNTEYTPWQGRKAMLTFEGCKDVEVKGNKIAEDVLGKNICTMRMDGSEVIIGEGQHIVRMKKNAGM